MLLDNTYNFQQTKSLDIWTTQFPKKQLTDWFLDHISLPIPYRFAEIGWKRPIFDKLYLNNRLELRKK